MSAPTLHPPGGYSLHDAASILGVSLNTLRKRIANGQVKAERIQRPQGHVWKVYLGGEDPASHPSDQDADLHAAKGSTTVQPPSPGAMQAEAMAAYTRSILAPMVEALERSEARSRELERDVGRLSAELAAARAPQSPPATPGAPQSAEPIMEPPALRSSPTTWLTPRRFWIIAVLVLVLIGVGVVQVTVTLYSLAVQLAMPG